MTYLQSLREVVGEEGVIEVSVLSKLERRKGVMCQYEVFLLLVIQYSSVLD